MKKRMLSMLLALVMVLGLLPVTARAGELDNALEYEVYEDHVTITDYTGDATELVIPAKIEGKPVTSIGESAFYECRSLTSIDLPASLTTIGDKAFWDCESLTSIDLPDSLTTIGDQAFLSCDSLTSIDFGDSLTYIGSHAFKDCSGLSSIDLPDSLTYIGSHAFDGCDGLTSIDFGDSLTTIANFAFDSCRSLTSIDLPDSLTYIGSSAFGACIRLNRIKFNGPKPRIASDAFFGVMAEVYYPAGVSTWTEDVMQDYGGSFIWIPYQHDHTSAGDAVVTAPTCTEQGYTTHTCTVCGDSYVDAFVDALGHDFVEGTCTRCGAADPDFQVPAETLFTDVPVDSFYAAPVLWAVENGITNGTDENTFNPNGSCLRAQVVTFLHRAVGNPAPSTDDNPFTDVKTGDFYYAPVLWAVENGITNGVDTDSFGTFTACNRAQVVTFLWRAAGCPEPEATANPFEDVKTTDFFYKPVLWAVENGITNGIDATHFGPTSACNRAQVVTFLSRAFNK